MDAPKVSAPDADAETDQRGFCAIGIYDNKFDVNMGTLIRSARLFGADYVFTVGFRYREQKSAVGHDRHLPVLDFETIADARPANDDSQLVGVVGPDVEDGTPTPLPSFSHPERAIYVLGAEDKGLPASARAECDQLVTIPVGEYSMNVSCAGTTVLYDREIASERSRTRYGSTSFQFPLIGGNE